MRFTEDLSCRRLPSRTTFEASKGSRYPVTSLSGPSRVVSELIMTVIVFDDGDKTQYDDFVRGRGLA